MNITFLIGNGFDLGLGLKTRFHDFYKIYCSEKSSDSFIDCFKQEILNNIKNWSDFEKAFGEYANDFNSTDVDKYLAQYENFVESFHNYLVQQEKEFDLLDKQMIFSIMNKSLTSFYDIKPADKAIIKSTNNFSRTELKNYNYICFNYTNCLDNCVNILKKGFENKKITAPTGDVIHVHGYIKNYMIMGVNDPSQILNDDFAKNPRVLNEIIKPNINREIKMNYDNLATQKIQDSNIICIYGMSLGETDKKWWQLIISWLKENFQRHLIFLSYEPSYKETFAHTWINSNTMILNKVTSYSNLTDAEKEQLKERIHVEFNHNIFGIDYTKNLKLNENNEIEKVNASA